MAGWLLLVGSIVTVAAVAVAYQVILPQVSTSFQFVGSAADAGLTNTPGGAKNAVILAVGLVVFTTIINMIGVKLMARINNVGVAAELVGVDAPDHPARRSTSRADPTSSSRPTAPAPATTGGTSARCCWGRS